MSSAGANPSRPALVYSSLALFIAVMVLAFLVFRHFLLTFAVAASLAILLSPIHGRLTRLFGGRRGLAAAVLVFATTITILLPILSYGALLSRQTLALYEDVRPHLEPEALQKFWTETLPDRSALFEKLRSWLVLDQNRWIELLSPAISRSASAANRLIQRAVTGLASAVLYLMLALVILFFLLRDGPRLGDEMRSISPLTMEQEDAVYSHLARTIKGVLYSMVLVPLLQGLLAMIGFSVFGLPAPLFWGVILILAAVIPGVGSPLVWAPAAIYLFVTGAAWQGIGLALYGTLIISTADNVLKPLLLQGTARIHALLAFLSILGGLMSFGVLGFLIGPVILSILLSAFRIYRFEIAGRSESPVTAQAQAAP
jgi:predicted PurR-regulated permease PerM